MGAFARSFPVAQDDLATPISGKSSGKFAARKFDMHGYRRRFPDLWRSFLRSHFRDAQHVAFMFSVTERTAQNWLHGVGSPRPEFVMKAVKHIPGAAMLLDAA